MIDAQLLTNRNDLLNLDQSFLDYVQSIDKNIHTKLHQYRTTTQDNSDFIIELAPILEQFISNYFRIDKELENYKQQAVDLDFLYDIKRNFFQRETLGKYTKENSLDANMSFDKLSDMELAVKIKNTKDPILLEDIKKYLAKQYYAGKKSVIFTKPAKLDFDHLFEFEKDGDHFKSSHLVERKGFNLTEHGVDLERALDQSKYCIYCHKRDKDSCSKGLHNKTNPLNNILSGCPLQQKISEMNLLFAEKFPIGALATIMIDNPLVAVTGNRICNDCQKACIFQTQDPVEIPQIESHILDTILNFPYGVEIYLLLARWNPLKPTEYLPAENTGRTIFVSGLGPSGFAISHYMLQSGHEVHAIDGLKIEPMPEHLELIKDYNSIRFPLEERKIIGFGGVVEYGITARFDKNKLYLIRLLLERNKNFQYNSGVRLGSTISIDDIFTYGYDHLAICHGAGDPNILTNKNALAKGVRIASDFLMNLQLSTAQQKTSLSNLQIRLPIVVIGSGLTAIDAATEARSYYLKQIETFNLRYGQLKDLHLTEEEQIIAEEFLRDLNRTDLPPTTILYRNELQKSPAYRTNHEEIGHAFREGIEYRENIEVLEFIVDKFGSIEKLKVKSSNGEEIVPARTVLLAVGTKPNNVVAKESSDIFSFNGKFIKTKSVIAQTSRHHDKISIFGDMHEQYTGSVVKALASAKNGYKVINNVLNTPSKPLTLDFKNELKTELRKITQLKPDIYELEIYAPHLVKKFKPGQFFRLQNYLTKAEQINNTNLSTEPIAISGSDIDYENSILKAVIIERGSSTKLIKYFKLGEEINLMGPAGEPITLERNQNILLIGGLIGNAILLPIMKEAKEKNCHITYICSLHNKDEVFYKEKVEEYVDEIYYSFNEPLESLLMKKKYDLTFIAGSKHLAETAKNYFEQTSKVQTLITSPMQCMMKEICAQCLQKHVDPKTQEVTYIYSCQNQNQNIFNIDFESLGDRLSQNSLLEKISSKWLDYCIDENSQK